MRKILNVQGMSCVNCANGIKESVGQLDGINEVNVNLDDAQVEVSFIDSQISLEKIKETIEAEGYEVK